MELNKANELTDLVDYNKEQRLDLNLIRVFCTVCEYQSITQAADALMLTQPSVSNAINRFKVLVGAPLFFRQGRGIAMTAIAKHLYNALAPMLVEIEQTVQSVKTFDPNTANRVFTVNANESFIDLIQVEIEQATATLPIEIVFNESNVDEQELYQELQSQQLDLALDIVAPKEASFKSQLVASESLACVSRGDHPQFAHGIDQASYFAAKHVFYRFQRQNQRVAELIATRHLPTRQMQGEKSSLLSMLSAVSKSDAICISPYTYAKNYQQVFSLNIMEMPFPSQKMDIYSVWTSKNHQDPANKWLRTVVNNAVAKVYQKTVV
ncbi:LysR family transcriptional regulator [Shewanella intestini]|uniref:LysR family transcriptional regulator n=1 Tax=Shewanella intestini TaxID=2017544 RepID=A0ABS5I006_9GAMM|nr:LysR family transcriptional regulator [Shewanella sp. XMDDZSB0408]MBR9727369.1 LysR family transcriptional regulator [Shewanella intestini]